MPRHSPYALVRLNLTFASSSLYELLEFHKTNNCYFGFSLQWKGFILFIFDWFTPPFRWNCNFTQIGKTINWFSCFSLNLNCPLICSFLTLQYSLFGFQWSWPNLPNVFSTYFHHRGSCSHYLTSIIGCRHCRLVGSNSNHSPTYRVLYAEHGALRFDPAQLSLRLVGSSGLEPPTSRLSGARSNHLSYEPM